MNSGAILVQDSLDIFFKYFSGKKTNQNIRFVYKSHCYSLYYDKCTMVQRNSGENSKHKTKQTQPAPVPPLCAWHPDLDYTFLALKALRNLGAPCANCEKILLITEPVDFF